MPLSPTDVAHLTGLVQGLLLAFPVFLVCDRLLDHLTRKADRARANPRR